MDYNIKSPALVRGPLGSKVLIFLQKKQKESYDFLIDSPFAVWTYFEISWGSLEVQWHGQRWQKMNKEVFTEAPLSHKSKPAACGEVACQAVSTSINML